MALTLRFLGTNGWYATPLGNGVCALIETPARYIVLDAGDGIWRLDHYVIDSAKPVDIFLSHFHLDHTIGLHIQPKFRMLKNRFRIFGMPGTRQALDALVRSPFTASFDVLRKQGFDISIHELKEGENRIDEYAVVGAPLVHADPCWGFRFELPRNSRGSTVEGRPDAARSDRGSRLHQTPASRASGKERPAIISYCTDTGPCDNLLALSQGADALITECSLLPGGKIDPGWPHLNPETAAQYAKRAGVGRLFLTHFAAHFYDTKKKREEAQAAARAVFKESWAAEDGQTFKI